MRKKLARAQTHLKTTDFLKLWPSLVSNYNSSHHSTIGMSPRSVNSNTQTEVFQNIYKNVIGKKPKPLKFKPGDFVKISKERLTFEKR